jgi:hypothetical protein
LERVQRTIFSVSHKQNPVITQPCVCPNLPALMPVSTSNLCAPQREQIKQNTIPVRSQIAHRPGLDFLAIGHLTISLMLPLVATSLARQDFSSPELPV